MTVVNKTHTLYQERSKKSMSGKKKKPQQDKVSKIVLATAIIELIKAVVELIDRLNE